MALLNMCSVYRENVSIALLYAYVVNEVAAAARGRSRSRRRRNVWHAHLRNGSLMGNKKIMMQNHRRRRRHVCRPALSARRGCILLMCQQRLNWDENNNGDSWSICECQGAAACKIMGSIKYAMLVGARQKSTPWLRGMPPDLLRDRGVELWKMIYSRGTLLQA